MNECIDIGVQEMLPDLLHGTLDERDRAKVEAHLGVCESCRQELSVLQAVKSAAVFEPAIDAIRIARQIPPYRMPIAPLQAPARSRVVSWLVAASVAVVVIGGGSLLLSRENGDTGRTPIAAVQSPQPGATVATVPESVVTPVVVSSPRQAPTGTRVYALAGAVDDLSDGDLRQLMSDMSQFDALPSAEPEPVIAVDNGDGLEQDFR